MPVATIHTDEQLMEQVQAEHLEALSLLFDRYQVPLFNFFYRNNYDHALSEDLVQIVFEKILRYRKTYNPNSAFRSWMYQIARNAKADHYKNQKRISDFVQPDELELEIDSIEQDLTRQEDLQQLEAALQRLTEDQREILVMTRFQKMKYQEVAEILDCSEGAVKVKVHRALKALRVVFFDMNK